MTGSQAVVLDRADLLDVDNRWGLEEAVQRVSGKTGDRRAAVLDGRGRWHSAVEAGHDNRRGDGMRIYLAARYSRLEELTGYADDLRAIGHRVEARWLLGSQQIHEGGQISLRQPASRSR